MSDVTGEPVDESRTRPGEVDFGPGALDHSIGRAAEPTPVEGPLTEREALDEVKRLCDEAERHHFNFPADAGLSPVAVDRVRAILGRVSPVPDPRVVAVLNLHQPDGGADGPGAMCVHCTRDFGTPAEDPVPYPCPTLQAMVDAAEGAALGGVQPSTPDDEMPSPLADSGDMQSFGPESCKPGGALDRSQALKVLHKLGALDGPWLDEALDLLAAAVRPAAIDRDALVMLLDGWEAPQPLHLADAVLTLVRPVEGVTLNTGTPEATLAVEAFRAFEAYRAFDVQMAQDYEDRSLADECARDRDAFRALADRLEREAGQ